jgi:hypothetical protein
MTITGSDSNETYICWIVIQLGVSWKPKDLDVIHASEFCLLLCGYIWSFEYKMQV